MFCVEELLRGPVSHQPWLLPGDARGSFELISGEAAGFCVGGSGNTSLSSQHPLGQGRTGRHRGLWARTHFAAGSLKPPVTKAWPNPFCAGVGQSWRETSRVQARRCKAHCRVLGWPLPDPVHGTGCRRRVQAGIWGFVQESGLEQCFESSALPRTSHT